MKDHEPAIPLSIHAVVERIGELEVVLGSQVRPTLDAVRRELLEAIGLREQGRIEAAFENIARAMDRLATLADGLDPAESMLMRSVTQAFRAALLRGNAADAREKADVMLQRSGAKPVKKS